MTPATHLYLAPKVSRAKARYGQNCQSITAYVRWVRFCTMYSLHDSWNSVIYHITKRQALHQDEYFNAIAEGFTEGCHLSFIYPPSNSALFCRIHSWTPSGYACDIAALSSSPLKVWSTGHCCWTPCVLHVERLPTPTHRNNLHGRWLCVRSGC